MSCLEAPPSWPSVFFKKCLHKVDFRNRNTCCQKVWKFRSASINWLAYSVLLGWDRINWSAKTGGATANPALPGMTGLTCFYSRFYGLLESIITLNLTNSSNHVCNTYLYYWFVLYLCGPVAFLCFFWWEKLSCQYTSQGVKCKPYIPPTTYIDKC